VYSGTTLALRVDQKLSVHKFQPLSHTGETKPTSLPCHFGVKANSRIAHGEMECTQCSEQFNLEVPFSTMLRRIEQRFLQHSEEGKGNLQRQTAWHLMAFEVNFNFMLVGELSAEAFDRRC
jgi:L-lactate utilization protein LutB